MRTRLFLSVAVATLSLGLSQGFAQQTGHGPGGDAAKQGESAGAQKPGEQGATEQRGERRSEGAQHQQQSQERTARDKRDKSEHAGAAARDEDKRATGKDEERRATGRDEDRQGGKRERHGATGEERDRTPTARGGGDAERQGTAGATGTDAERRAKQSEAERAGRTGERKGAAATGAERRATQSEAERAGRAGERTGAATRDAERRATQSEAERAGRAGERTGASGNEDERRAAQSEAEKAGRGGMEGRGDVDRQRGREAFERGARGREAYGYAGREGRGGGRFQLSQRDTTRIRQVLARRDVQRVPPGVFTPRIGAVLPPNVQFYPVPSDIIAFAPQFRGYDYVMVGDDFAIIDPGTREVVTVLDEGGPAAAYGYGYGEDEQGYEGRGQTYGSGRRDETYRGSRRDEFAAEERGGRRERRGEAYGYAPRVRLDDRQERALYRGVMSEARSNLRQVCVRVGERVPESVDIEPVPRNIAAEAPDVERYDYFVLNDQVVLVDPDSRIVVDIIQQPR